MASLSQSLHVGVPPQEEQFAREALQGARVVSETLEEAAPADDVRVLSVSSQERVELQWLARFPSLEAVITRSTGCDRLPLQGMRELGIRAYHLDGYATESVAQHTLMFILMLLRRVPEASWMTSGRGAQGRPVWDRSGLQGRSLQDVTVGVLGTGRIGSRVVRLLTGMGASVVGHDVAPERDFERLEGFRYAGSFEELLGVSEVLTVHVPLTAATTGLLDHGALDRLPPGSLLVNTARGGIVDQEAVAERLRDGRLGGYAADVLPGEPQPDALASFCDLPTAVLTPHLAAYDKASLNARYEVTAQVAMRVLAGEEEVLRDHVASVEAAI